MGGFRKWPFLLILSVHEGGWVRKSPKICLRNIWIVPAKCALWQQSWTRSIDCCHFRCLGTPTTSTQWVRIICEGAFIYNCKYIFQFLETGLDLTVLVLIDWKVPFNWTFLSINYSLNKNSVVIFALLDLSNCP